MIWWLELFGRGWSLGSHIWLTAVGSETVVLEELVLIWPSVVLVSIELWEVGEDNLIRAEFDTSACFLPRRYKTDDLILISFLLTPDWISVHLSFISKRSVSCSWIDMSGLTVMPSGRSLLLDRMDETSIARFSFIKSGRGRWEWALYLPRRKQSLIENDCISASNFESTGSTWSTSCLFLSDLDVPLGHSWIPYTTTLYLRSGNCTLVEAAFFCVLIDSGSDEFWWLGGLVGDSVVDEDFSRLSSEVSFLTASFNSCISAACDFRWQCGQ